MASKENTIQNQVLQYLKNKGFFVWRNNNHATKGRAFIGNKGIGDIIGVLPCGTFLSIEVKTKSGVVSEHQHKFIMDVKAHGGIGLIIRSIDDIQSKLPCTSHCKRLVKQCHKHRGTDGEHNKKGDCTHQK